VRIAHRIRTVIDYDMVMVVDGGQIVGFDTSLHRALLGDESSMFYQMCKESGEIDALKAV
ncbi:Transporter of the ATP-binding cassette (ABC), partial [Spiromyces aspiralis]